MEIVGKFLFLILLSVSIGAGAVYVVGPSFFTSSLDQNLFDSDRYEYQDDVDVKEYRKKLSAEYQEYSEQLGSKKISRDNSKDYEPIWEDSAGLN